MGLRKIYLLDTNIVSEPAKSNPSEKILGELETKGLFSEICAPVWYELNKGVEVLPEGKKHQMYDEFNSNYVQTTFPIIPYDEHCAKIDSEIFACMKKNGTPVSPIDSQIAATALANNLILVTRNTKHFEPIQKEFSLCVENWFED